MNSVIQFNKKPAVMVFLESLNSPNTRRSYHKSIKDFLSYVGTRDPRDFTTQHFVDYKNALQTSYTPKTVAARLAALKSMMSFFVKQGIITKDPSEIIKVRNATAEKDTVALTDAEVRLLIDISVDDDDYKSKVHQAMIMFCLKLGLRRAELLNIELDDIYEDGEHTVLKVFGKGGKHRRIPLSDEMSKFYNNYRNWLISFVKHPLYLFPSSERGNTKYNENSFYRILKRRAESVGIDKRISPHSLRATVISHLFENGVAARDIADFAGHSDIKTTLGYDKKRDGLNNSAAYKVAL